MLDDFLDRLKSFCNSRIIPIAIIFIIVFGILFRQLFIMQIVEGRDTVSTEEYKLTAERDIKSTRGLIYDRNGVLLAENVLKYSVVMSHTALITNNSEKNTMIYRLINVLEKYGNKIELDFCIELDENDEFVFNVSGNAELRFKKNAYGKSYISDLNDEQRNATAKDVYEYLKNDNLRFQISDQYTIEEILKIMTIRYTLLIQNPQHSQFTLSSDVNIETVAAIKENMADLPGVEIQQQTFRVYYDAMYFAHIIGYTGLITTTELEKMNEKLEDDLYLPNDYVGKNGIEKSMEEYLSGTKGTEQLVVNKINRILSSQVIIEPEKGNDIYLTVDRDLQVACYHILERNIAAILISKITNSLDYGTKYDKASGILIPIYEVYNALIANNVINIMHFKDDDATELEKKVLGYFIEKRAGVLSNLRVMTAYDSKVTNESAGEEMKVYLEYIYQLMQSSTAKNLVVKSKVDKNDQMYKDYIDSKIGIAEYLQYAISKKWVDLSVIGIEYDWYTIDEIYDMMMEYIFKILENDKEFEKEIYRTLVFTRKLSGKEICLLLFDQNVIEYNENDYKKLYNGNISAYEFMINKLKNIEITPAQLALEPCSGSIVINNVNTGEVLAMVSYPSYDNNKFANKIQDIDYYNNLNKDKASPLMNRPSQQQTATGSTFKPLAALIGLGEGTISTTTQIYDKGEFESIDPSPKCWKYPGTHGSINVTQAIMHSCNYFFYEIGYRMSLNSRLEYEDNKGLNIVKEYAAMFGLNSRSGIEMEEYDPVISSKDSVRSMIGYYHNFSPVQISKYISTVATSGICMDLTLISQIKANDQTTVRTLEPKVYNNIDIFSTSQWNAVQKGMYNVVNTGTNSLNKLYGNLGISVAGKTGTAQVSTSSPNHALFTSYAPYENPEISVTVVIPNGYTSANAAFIAREVYGLYYNGENKEALLSGNVKAGTATDIKISD